MESVVSPPLLERAYRGKRVLVTGHTGFKGSWLSEWLLLLGAEVAGFSLPPDTAPALFDQLALASRLHHQVGDVRDFEEVRGAMRDFGPDCVFHLAAQPLVRASYEIPLATFATNTLGTAHVLEALRGLDRSCAAVIVTTDKCYENLESDHAYRETDRLGGHDPYSASKAAAELIVQSYRDAFFSSADARIRLASARAGNVLGGGDWARDRMVPDAIRALSTQKKIAVRNPRSVRPWQHVLEPLSGYLTLGARLQSVFPSAVEGSRESSSQATSRSLPSKFATAFNFGPDVSANRTVADLIAEILRFWPGEWIDVSAASAPHEARLLRLDVRKAAQVLGWRPVWDFSETVEKVIEWYRTPVEQAAEMTRRQIAEYIRDAAESGVEWASP